MKIDLINRKQFKSKIVELWCGLILCSYCCFPSNLCRWIYNLTGWKS
jgi:hypothetical protein